MSLFCQPFLFSFRKNPHERSGIATKPAAKHQHSDKSLKINHQSLKDLENETPNKDVASLFVVARSLSPLGKKQRKNKPRV